MLIRDERPDDASRIATIHAAAFKGHPAHAPGAEPTEHLIVEHLRASGALALSLLAEADGEAVGHVALSPVRVGEEHSGWLLLGPVGVLPPMQGRGLGTGLMREALKRSREAGARGIVLVGDPGFYTRFGFAAAPGLVYPGVPEQYVLALGFSGEAPRGKIAAHEAFRLADGQS